MTSRALIALGALLLLLSAAACKPRPAPTITFGRCDGRAYEVHLRGTPSACAVLGEGEFAPNLAVTVDGTDLLIGAHNSHDGWKLSAEGKVVASDQGNALLRLPIASSLASLQVAAWTRNEPLDFGKTFTLSIPGRADAVVKVPPVPVGWALAGVLAGAAKGPVTLPGEGAAPRAHSVLFAERSFASPVLGPAKTFAELDWVAVKTMKGQHDLGTCEYQFVRSRPGSTTSGGRLSVKKLGLEETVTIYARRTGAVVDRKDFRAPAEGKCPSSLGAARDVTIPIELEEVRAWLKDRITK